MKNTTAIASAILFGFLLVAAALFFRGSGEQQRVVAVDSHNAAESADSVDAHRSKNQHIFGNTDAAVTIVEFSDYQCPFCARLHPTLERIVDESEGAINWEYRHLPIPSHRSAEFAAVASECIAQNIGEAAFWDFTSTIFHNQRSVSDTYVRAQAELLGVDADMLSACKENGAIDTQISDDVRAARLFGGSGTPFSVIVYADGTTKPVSGALPYEQWVGLLSN